MEHTHSQMGSEEEESSHTEPLQQHFDGNYDGLSLKSVAATYLLLVLKVVKMNSTFT